MLEDYTTSVVLMNITTHKILYEDGYVGKPRSKRSDAERERMPRMPSGGVGGSSEGQNGDDDELVAEFGATGSGFQSSAAVRSASVRSASARTVPGRWRCTGVRHEPH